jgi:polyphosphate glucokinase
MTVDSAKILAIDIGGSRIKAILLANEGTEQSELKKINTPIPATPERILAAIKELTNEFKSYNRISVGFPGYVKEGIVFTAPNLGNEFWKEVPFAKLLAAQMNCPVRLLNDADMQGLGIAKGKGFEIVVTLGTGFGTALLINGNLLPHIELAHHPITREKDYDDYIGEKALEEVGVEHWNKRMQKVVGILKTVFHYDYLYLGGGNSKKISFPLENNITQVSNKDGIRGGAKLWQNEDHYGVISIHPN